MKKFMISSVAVFAAFAFAGSVSAVSATEIYTPTSGYLKVGSGMGAKVSQMANVMAAQKALNICTNSSLVVDGKFGPLTTGVFKAFQASKGIAQDGIIGPVTAAQLAACSGDVSAPSTGSTTLNGGAGDMDLSSSSTNVESTVEEGKEDVIVLGMKAEANNSDIQITNVRVNIEATNGTGSTRIEKYLDEVSVWLDGKKVGSVDADEFSKDGTEYSKNISLSGAVIKEDATARLYVAVSALSSVDDDSKKFEVTVNGNDVRYKDASGAILSASGTYTEKFEFDEEGVDDELTIKSSSNNPDATNLKVKEGSNSDDHMIFAFNLEADDDSSDITVNELPITISASTSTIDSIINELYVKIGSKKYSADAVGSTTGTSAVYSVEFDDDFVVDSGDKEEVKVYAVFNKLDGNYTSGTTVSASVTSGTIDAEGTDEVTVTGNASGKAHALVTDAPMFTLNSKSFTLSQAIDGTSAGDEDVFEAVFKFTINADDETVYLPITSTTSSGSILAFTAAGSVIDSIILEADDDSIEQDNSFMIEDSENFTLTFTLRGNNASNLVNITGFGLANDDSATPDFTVTSGLDKFKSVSKYLAK